MKKLIPLCGVGLLVVMVMAVPAHAELLTLGIDPCGPSPPASEFAYQNSVPNFTGGPDLPGWWIKDPQVGGPQEIAFVPGYGWWWKWFWGYQLGQDLPSIDEGATLVIREDLMVNDHHDDKFCWWWWDWDEFWWLLNPGWKWGPNPIIWVDDGGGTFVPWSFTRTGDPFEGIIFKFDQPLKYGYKIRIWKPIIWWGPGPWIYPGPLRIWEYPTPEPATMAMLGLGGLALLARRRRRRA